MGSLYVSPQAAGGMPPLNGYLADLPRLTQADYLTSDPFSAYLLSLTDPAAEALAALNRAAAGTPAAAVAAAGRAGGPVLTALLAGAASPGLGTFSPDNPGPAAVAIAAAPGPTEASAGASAAALSPVQAPVPRSEGARPEEGNQAPQAAAAGAATQASDAVAAANAAAVASSAAFTANAASAASSIRGESSGLAVDATAKFMGAGAMGLPETVLSAYQVVQGAIPAVQGVLGTSAMAANTSSNPQGRAFGHTAAPFHPAPLQAPAAGGTAALDLRV